MSNKIALISDIHFGVHKNSDLFLKNQIDYLNNEFLTYLIEKEIDTIYILGDLFDNRNSINVKVQNECYDLLEKINEKFICYLLIGNHDSYYQDRIDINSLKYFSKFSSIHIIDSIKKIGNILLVPWQTDEDFIKNIEKYKSDICFGHFDIIGFNQTKYKICEKGISSKLLFDNFKLTITGHYHTRSIKKSGNSSIIYIGNPYHSNRGDVNEIRGFCILDIKTLEYEFINSKNTIKFISLQYPNTFDEKLIKNNIIDVCIDYSDSYDNEKVQTYIKEIEKLKPIVSPTIKINNKYTSIDEFNNTDLNLSNQELINRYINILEYENSEKEKIKQLMEELYNECKESVG